MTRTLPCCGCACSATRLFGCHPSQCSPPLFHSHVRVNSVLAARTACLASRVACVRAWSWLSHPRPPDRSQHGCTVGVLPGPTRVLPMPGSMASVAERQLVLCWSVCCGASYTVCGLCRQYVLYCVLRKKKTNRERKKTHQRERKKKTNREREKKNHQKRRKPPSEEEKTPTRRGENPHQKRRKPTEEKIHPTEEKIHPTEKKNREKKNQQRKNNPTVREIRALSHQYHVEVDLQHSSTAMLL